MSFRVVVKGGGGPALHVMTIGTLSLIVLCHELTVVGVLMAGLAGLGSALEARLVRGSRLVTIGTGDGPMGTE